MTWSVRSRITLVASLVVLLVLALTGTALLATQRLVLTDSVDEVLQRHSTAVAARIDEGALTRRLTGQGDDESFARVVDESGNEIASTRFLPAPAPELACDATLAAPYCSVTMPDGVEYRVLTRQHARFLISTGTPLDDVNESVGALARGLAIAIPAATLLLAAAVWLLVGRVLGPVERIRGQVAEITGSNLHRRVPEPGTGDEIDKLAHTMNEMLERISLAVERQRRFVADASHELRSPLARIRAELEVDLAHPEVGGSSATHRRVLEEVEALHLLTEDLLTLARSDSGTRTGRHEPVDLDDVVMDEVRRQREATVLRGRGVAIDVSAVSGAQVIGNAGQLSRVVRNLLDNATQHGARTVTIALGEHHGEVVLSVADDGDGIPEEFRERVFERFSRVDDARSSSRGGAGLGLAIARELTAANGGSIRVDPAHAPGARLVVRLPAAGITAVN